MPKLKPHWCRAVLPMLVALTACATPSPPPMQPSPVPPLDSKLAEPCPALVAPDTLDFDAWQAWMVDVLQQYSECAIRHRATVAAWPK